MVSRDTPPKKEAAPIRAKAPGSSQAQKGVVFTPNIRIARQPTNRPNNPPINLGVCKIKVGSCRNKDHVSYLEITICICGKVKKLQSEL